MGIDDESSHPELCSEVADGVTRSLFTHWGVCLFREPGMREICLSGSMSGNRNRAKPNRTEAAKRKPSLKKPPGAYSHCACFRLYSPLHSERESRGH